MTKILGPLDGFKGLLCWLDIAAIRIFHLAFSDGLTNVLTCWREANDGLGGRLVLITSGFIDGFNSYRVNVPELINQGLFNLLVNRVIGITNLLPLRANPVECCLSHLEHPRAFV